MKKSHRFCHIFARSKHFLLFLAMILLLPGCAAVGKLGGKTADAVGGGYELLEKDRDRVDGFKATIAKDNLQRTQGAD